LIECARLTRTENAGGPEGWPQEDEPDVNQRGTSERKVPPLVRAGDQSSDQSGDDHDQVEEDQGDDVRERKTGGEYELEEETGGGDDPIDVTDIPDVSSGRTVEFGSDGGGTKIRSHGKVGLRSVNGVSADAMTNMIRNSTHDGGGGQEDDSQVMEHSPSLGKGETPGHHCEIGHEHDGKDCPEEV
jgi:hypothetical protein